MTINNTNNTNNIINTNIQVLTNDINTVSLDHNTLECGNQCKINLDNLKWKRTTNSIIYKTQNLKIHNQQASDTNVYKYLILDIKNVSDGIDNNVYELGYIIYMNKKYYLQNIYIPLYENSNIHKYSKDDKDIREIIFIYTSTDNKAGLCMSVFINIGFDDVNIGDNFFNELKSLSTTSSGSGQSKQVRNNWLPQNIFPVKKSFLKYNPSNNSNSSTNDNFIFPDILKDITDVTWILYIKSVYINKDTFNKLIDEQSELPKVSLASKFTQNSNASTTLSPVPFHRCKKNYLLTRIS